MIEGLVRVRDEVRVGREQRRDAACALDRLDVAHGQDGGVHLPHAGPRRVLDRGRDADDGARHHSQGSDVASSRVMPSPSTTKMPGRAMGTPRPHAFRRRLAIAVPLALVGMLVVSSAAHAGLLAPEAGGSKNADAIRTLYWLVFGLGVIIFIGVEGVLIYSLFKYRARKGAVAAQIHGNTQLEIGWTVGAAVILVFIAIFTFATLPTIRNPPNSDAAAASTRRDHERRRGLRPGEAAAERQVAGDQRQRPAVRLALHVRRRRQQPAEQRLRLRGDGRSGRRHGDAEASAPRTSRTPGGSRSSAASSTRSRSTRTTRGSRSRPTRRAAPSAGSAPSSAGATTRT